MNITIEIDEKTLKELIKVHVESLMNKEINLDKISIKVKSKQNYKAEWEEAAFKATYVEIT